MYTQNQKRVHFLYFCHKVVQHWKVSSSKVFFYVNLQTFDLSSFWELFEVLVEFITSPLPIFLIPISLSVKKWGWLFIRLTAAVVALLSWQGVYLSRELWWGRGCLRVTLILSYFRLLLLLLLWSLPRLLSTLRRRITVISIMGTSLAAGHVTTLRMGWVMYLCIAMLIQVTAHPISSPPTNINLPVTESTAIHYYLNVLMQSYLFCQHVCLCWRNKISFSADILFVFCEWVTYSALSPLELPISYFKVWLLKLPLKICAVLSNWKHKISIMISQ